MLRAGALIGACNVLNKTRDGKKPLINFRHSRPMVYVAARQYVVTPINDGFGPGKKHFPSGFKRLIGRVGVDQGFGFEPVYWLRGIADLLAHAYGKSTPGFEMFTLRSKSVFLKQNAA